MPGFLVHIGALTNCPHAGAVTAPPPAPPRVFVNVGQAVLTMANPLTVAGCPFQVPAPTPSGTKPQPCVTVRVQPATRVFINGQPAALLTPQTLCYSVEQLPQGPPNSAATQKRVIAT
jgi:hypothetical protein